MFINLLQHIAYVPVYMYQHHQKEMGISEKYPFPFSADGSFHFVKELSFSLEGHNWIHYMWQTLKEQISVSLNPCRKTILPSYALENIYFSFKYEKSYQWYETGSAEME